jgi:hypothetical protein
MITVLIREETRASRFGATRVSNISMSKKLRYEVVGNNARDLDGLT